MKKTLTELRVENKMTQRELAEAIGISTSSVGMYEIGERIPPLKTAIRIAKFFNTQVENISFSKS